MLLSARCSDAVLLGYFIDRFWEVWYLLVQGVGKTTPLFRESLGVLTDKMEGKLREVCN
jgi:hypothetical protein